MAQTATAERQPTQAQTTTPPGEPSNGKITLRDAVQDFQQQLVARQSEYAPALPPHISPDRFRSTVTTAVNLNPDLLRADRLSLFNSCTKAAHDGLMPDGREGALVIFNTKTKVDGKEVWIKKVTWMPMVYGIIKKARQSGEIATLGARIVYANELVPTKDAAGNVTAPPRFRFTIEDGEDKLAHDPILFEERGAPVGVYARVKFKDGSIEYEILNKAEVEKMRAVSKSKDSGPWAEWWEEMAKKSAIRRLGKRLPLSPELQTTLSRDDEVTEYEQIKASERARLMATATAQLGAPQNGNGHENDGPGFSETEEPGDETVPEPLRRATRLLKLCKTKPEIDDLLKSIADELGDEYERGLLKQLGQTRMTEL